MPRIHRLRNGIRLISDLDEKSKLTYLSFNFLNCALPYENENNNGIHHFIEHLLFKGTKNRTAKQISNEIGLLGGSINASTSSFKVTLDGDFYYENFDKGVDFFLDMAQNSIFPEEEVNKERDVVIEEIKRANDNPNHLFWDNLFSNYYEGQKFGYPILGSKENILKNITLDEIKKVYHEHFCNPNNIIVICIGNFNLAKLIDKLENSYNSSSVSAKEFLIPQKPEVIDRVHEKDLEQIYFATFSPLQIKPSSEIDMITVNAFVDILGDSFSSRLFKKIREELGYAYSIHAFLYNVSGDYRNFLFLVSGGTSKEKIKDAMYQINQEIQKICQNGVSEEEVEIIKQKNQHGLASAERSLYKKADFYLTNYLHHNGSKIDSFEEMINKTKSLTVERVSAVGSLLNDLEDYSKFYLGKM